MVALQIAVVYDVAAGKMDLNVLWLVIIVMVWHVKMQGFLSISDDEENIE